jgi:hypothetical protein
MTVPIKPTEAELAAPRAALLAELGALPDADGGGQSVLIGRRSRACGRARLREALPFRQGASHES